MYFSCGAIVILASIWLFIGNFINYRLLERERKDAEQCKRTDPDWEQDHKGADSDAQAAAAEELDNDTHKAEESVQRETNL